MERMRANNIKEAVLVKVTEFLGYVNPNFLDVHLGQIVLKNPMLEFSKALSEGAFNSMPGEDFEICMENTEKLARIFEDKPYRGLYELIEDKPCMGLYELMSNAIIYDACVVDSEDNSHTFKDLWMFYEQMLISTDSIIEEKEKVEQNDKPISRREEVPTIAKEPFVTDVNDKAPIVTEDESDVSEEVSDVLDENMLDPRPLLEGETEVIEDIYSDSFFNEPDFDENMLDPKDVEEDEAFIDDFEESDVTSTEDDYPFHITDDELNAKTYEI